MRSVNVYGLGLLAGATLVSAQSYAEVYLSEEQALKILFPGEEFSRKPLVLSSAEADKIAEASGETVRQNNIMAWISKKKNVVYIDQVLGKHEFITYAVAIGNDSKVKGIEILEYKESYGSDVRKEPWRQQFVGKDKLATLKLNKDIVNISGATLSSAHITGGVRRMLQTHELLRTRL